MIPSGITKIEGGVFSDCMRLEKLEIGNQVTEAGANAFSNCRDLKEVKLPNTMKLFVSEWNEWGKNDSFYGCGGVEKIVYTQGDGEVYQPGVDNHTIAR